MRTRQVTIAFETPVNTAVLAKILSIHFPDQQATVGEGVMVNGIHQDWILVEKKGTTHELPR